MKSTLWRKKSFESILQEQDDHVPVVSHLKRSLTVRDLTAFGIAAIVGAGIFSTIGNAAANGGPAISLLFVFTAIACGFSALCYAEFASKIPVAGSAYTYAYYSLGELIAWIIGWDLLLEYAIGNIACAISWSDYFTEFIKGFGWYFPDYLSMDYFSALRAHKLVLNEADLSALPHHVLTANQAWLNAPQLIGNIKLIADVPALFIVAVITYIVFIGIKESRTANNIMVSLKLLVIFGVIVTGSFYVHPGNWSPFAPEGVAGVLKGVSAVFFAFIGFDAISTTAEECKNPTRDLPRAIFYALAICTVLYVLIAMVLTGMVHYKDLAVGDPLAFVFKEIGLDWVSGVIAFTALIAMAGVILIFQLGQPRIWMSMSRDGLLPRAFSKIHPKYRTPSFATIITGIVVAVPALFMNLTEVTDLTSIGTLFAFIIVCGGVLVLQHTKTQTQGVYRVPYVNGKYIIPLLVAGIILLNVFLLQRLLAAVLKAGKRFSYMGTCGKNANAGFRIFHLNGILAQLQEKPIIDSRTWPDELHVLNDQTWPYQLAEVFYLADNRIGSLLCLQQKKQQIELNGQNSRYSGAVRTRYPKTNSEIAGIRTNKIVAIG